MYCTSITYYRISILWKSIGGYPPYNNLLRSLNALSYAFLMQTHFTVLFHPGDCGTGSSSPQSNVTNTYSIGFTLLNQESVIPQTDQMTQVLNEYKESRAYAMKSTFSTPSSLPLYFYFGYQLLQESKLLQSCGHVSKRS
jgi:hypothetical protein